MLWYKELNGISYRLFDQKPFSFRKSGRLLDKSGIRHTHTHFHFNIYLWYIFFFQAHFIAYFFPSIIFLWHEQSHIESGFQSKFLNTEYWCAKSISTSNIPLIVKLFVETEWKLISLSSITSISTSVVYIFHEALKFLWVLCAHRSLSYVSVSVCAKRTCIRMSHVNA